jgi:hypothetical protein
MEQHSDAAHSNTRDPARAASRATTDGLTTASAEVDVGRTAWANGVVVGYRPGPRSVVSLQRYLGNHTVTHLLRERSAVAAGQTPLRVQRVIATQPAALLVGAPVALQVRLQNIGARITQYNLLAQNAGLAQHVRMKRQFKQLRLLKRAIVQCMDRISNTTLELSDDPIAQRLHTLHNEVEAEHRPLVDTMVNNPGLINQVTPFKTTGLNPGQIAAAKAEWTSMMNSAGKIKLVGDAAHQQKVRSWITQLMDTAHGRAILGNLNTPNAGRGATALDEMSHTFIGQNPGQLPGTVTGHLNYNPAMQPAPVDPQAQPLKPVNTTQLAARGGGLAANYNAVANPDQFVNEVLAGSAGVAMNGAEYDFNAVGSGSFVNMEESGAHVPTVSGRDKPLGPGNAPAKPEVYMPDWVLLGHELGHSVNMRAGSATNANIGVGNPTMDAFAAQWSGLAPGPRTQNWYGGSEEYINILGTENRLRAQGGLKRRGGHISPKAPKMLRRGQAIAQAFNAAGWAGNLHGSTQLVLNNEYNTVNMHIAGTLNANSTQVQYTALLLMATRFQQFVTAWVNLQTAHDAASKSTRFGLYAWWRSAKGVLPGIGAVIQNNNAATFNQRRQQLINLTARY